MEENTNTEQSDNTHERERGYRPRRYYHHGGRFSDERQKVAIFVDGPNMLRKEFSVDLRDLKQRAEKYGRVIIGKVYVNQFAPEKLVEAIINEGFEAIMVLGERNEEQGESADVDVSMTVGAMEAIINRDIDIIGIATRDADFLPVIQKSKENGKKVIVFGLEPAFSTSLQNAADFIEMM